MPIFQVNKTCTITVDIIPYEVKGKLNPWAKEGDLWYERTYWTHRNVGPDPREQYCCLAKTFRMPCPICEFRGAMMRDPEHDEKLVYSLKPSERQIFNIIDLSDKEKGIQLFSYSQWLFGKVLLAKIRRYDDGRYNRFSDLEEGLSVSAAFEKDTSGGFQSYKCVDIEFVPRRKAYDEEILEEAACLDDILKQVPYKELKKIFTQVPEEEEAPKRSTAKKDDRKKSKVKEEEPEEDEDDDEVDSELEEDEDEPEDEQTAEDAGIELGTMVEHEEHGICKVVHVSGDGTSLRLKDSDEKIHKAIAPSECTVVEDEEEAPKKKSKVKTKAKGKTPPPKKKGKKDEEEDEDDDDLWEDDDDDDDEDDD